MTGEKEIFTSANRERWKGYISTVTRISKDTVRKQYRPVFLWMKEREKHFLEILSIYTHFPKLLGVGNDYIDMNYCGEKVNNIKKYKDQKDFIIMPLMVNKIIHRDINKNNLLILNGKLMLIDFSWAISEYEKDTPIPAPRGVLGGIGYRPESLQGIWDDNKAFDKIIV